MKCPNPECDTILLEELVTVTDAGEAGMLVEFYCNGCGNAFSIYIVPGMLVKLTD